ncbi:MAG: hypothetical protein IVW51_04520 [Thermaceae bacterium]|nr:hypothetical protein [Thermaceae bacterium]
MPSRYEDIITAAADHVSKSHTSAGIEKKPFDFLNGVPLTELNYDELRAACVASSLSLIYKGMNMIVTRSHIQLWDRIGELLLNPPSVYLGHSPAAPTFMENMLLPSLFMSTVKTAIGTWGLCRINALSWDDESQLTTYKVNPAEYLVYPLLEGVVKRAKSAFFNTDGIVSSGFTISYDGISRTYRTGKRCSNIGHMLALLYDTSDSQLQDELRRIFEHIAFVTGENHYVVIVGWRNPALHGHFSIPTTYGVLLNIVFLIALDYAKSRVVKKMNGKDWHDEVS